MPDPVDYSTFDDDLKNQINPSGTLDAYLNQQGSADDLLKAIGINPDSTGKWDSPSNKQILQDMGYSGNFSLADIGSFIKKAFTNASDGSLNVKALGALAGAGLGLAGAGAATVKPTGYQGGIPNLVANQPMLTAPPEGRRPGSGGINYGTGVQYTDSSGKVVSDTSTPVATLASIAANNPFNEKQTNYGNAPVPSAPVKNVQTFVPPVNRVKAKVDDSVNSAQMIANIQSQADQVNAANYAKSVIDAKAKADAAAKIQADAAAAAKAAKDKADAAAKAIVDAQTKKAAEDAAKAATAAAAAAAKAAADKAAADAATKAAANKAAADAAAKASADAAFAKTPEGMAKTLGKALPADWSKYEAKDKIDWFNKNNLDPSKLLSVGISQADIDWMKGHGYTGTATGGIENLPSGFDKKSAEDKIKYFNDNNIGIDKLLQAGTSQADIDWMGQHGYTGGTSKVVSDIFDTRPEKTDIFAGFTGGQKAVFKDYSPEKKIEYFNNNNITPQMLLSNGVSQADIDYMTQHGYKGASTGIAALNSAAGVNQNNTAGIAALATTQNDPAAAAKAVAAMAANDVDDTTRVDKIIYGDQNNTRDDQVSKDGRAAEHNQLEALRAAQSAVPAQSAAQTQASSIGVTLPSDFSNYEAADKINYFNEKGIGADKLLQSGTSQADIDWMNQHGYTGGANNVSNAGVDPGFNMPMPVTENAGNPTPAPPLVLPEDFSTYGANDKINYFNQNNVSAADLIGQGVSQDDIDWMKQNGYKGMAAGGITNLDHGGFVVPADVVSHFGNGSSSAGLELLAEKMGATPIKGRGDGMSDSIPAAIDGQEKALVANEEAYLSPEMVQRLGDGDMDAGSRKLKQMMEKIRQARTGSKEQGKQINPNNFMPGGSVGYAQGGEIKRYAGTDPTGSLVQAGVTGTEQNLSKWVGPYATNMLGQAQALANSPYQAYTGPLTAGASGLQNAAFTSAGNLTTPNQIGTAAVNANALGDTAAQHSYDPTSFSNQFFAPTPYTNMGSPQYAQLTPQTVESTFQAPEVTNATTFTNQFSAPTAYQGSNFTSGTFGTNEAKQYMNPYLQQSLDPQLAEARRQSDITAQQNNAAMTKAGAYGGGRQAILTSENQRNLGTNLANITGQGYNTAYTNAMGQYNQDQSRNMQAQQATEASKQFGANQGMTAAQMMAQYGMSAQQAQEAARQANQNYGLQAATTAGSQSLQAGLANQGAGLTAGQGNINAALAASQQLENSRQFGAGQSMNAAQQAANYGMQAANATEASNQFANQQGLAGLSLANSAYSNAGNLGALQNSTNLSNINAQSGLGAIQRGIQSEGIAADKAQFEEARKDPYTKLQFQQSMLNGMPITATNYNLSQPSAFTSAAGGATTLAQFLKNLGIG